LEGGEFELEFEFHSPLFVRRLSSYFIFLRPLS
jgi:hypothetical protein